MVAERVPVVREHEKARHEIEVGATEASKLGDVPVELVLAAQLPGAREVVEALVGQEADGLQGGGERGAVGW